MKKRKARASTVQSMADWVAEAGQLSQPYNKIRDFIMKNATHHFQSI